MSDKKELNETKLDEVTGGNSYNEVTTGPKFKIDEIVMYINKKMRVNKRDFLYGIYVYELIDVDSGKDYEDVREIDIKKID